MQAHRVSVTQSITEAWMNNIQERLGGAFGTPVDAGPLVTFDTAWNSPGAAPPSLGGDSIRQFPPCPFGRSCDGANGLMQQLLSMLANMFGMGGASAGGSSYYQNASASSTGDPHLAFNGTNASGNAQQTRFNSMSSHEDLLSSDSFEGGYRVSTRATQPDASGVTYNRKATVTTGYGQTRVSLDNGGNASISQNGRTCELARGQSYNLGNGESVDYGKNGSLVVTDRNAQGGTIKTTLSENGQGIDVHTQASNVDLGGDVVHGPSP